MTDSAKNAAVSILMPTFDRAEQLRVTLESFAQIDSAHAFELVLIDNNSTDHTASVIDDFEERLPIRRLSESRPGKNPALNRALAEPGLAPIVVFTDDDISPNPGWLDAIVDSCGRHPDCDVFGGRVRIDWPVDDVPKWALDPEILGWGFAHLDLGDEEAQWPERRFPVGSNYWVRRDVVLDRGFDDTLGPRPSNRIMGDEAAFLKQLADDGHRAWYVPSATIDHRIQPAMVTLEGIRKRAFYVGRSAPHLWGLNRADLLERSKLTWYALRLVSLARASLLYTIHSLRGDVVQAMGAMRTIAYNVENLRLANTHEKSNP